MPLVDEGDGMREPEFRIEGVGFKSTATLFLRADSHPTTAFEPDFHS